MAAKWRTSPWTVRTFALSNATDTETGWYSSLPGSMVGCFDTRSRTPMKGWLRASSRPNAVGISAFRPSGLVMDSKGGMISDMGSFLCLAGTIRCAPAAESDHGHTSGRFVCCRNPP